MIPKEDLYSQKAFLDGRIIFSEVFGTLEWGVWARESETDPWTLWTKRRWCAPDDCAGADCITENKSYKVSDNLGEIPREFKRSSQLQLLIRFRGYAQLQAVRVRVDMADSDDTPAGVCSGSTEVVEFAPCDYNDYEYSEPEPTWTV